MIKLCLINQWPQTLRQYKQGVMQKLFSQEVRFGDERGTNKKSHLSCLQSIGKLNL